MASPLHRALRAAAVGVAVLLAAACASTEAARAPDADLAKLETFYVIRVPEDERGVEKLIAQGLVARGLQATSGDAEKPDAPVDAIVTYQDRWMWDITMYMIRLTLQVRDGNTGAVLARGEVTRPSLQRKSPEGMVKEALETVFK